jgi:hypothetical protein
MRTCVCGAMNMTALYGRLLKHLPLAASAATYVATPAPTECPSRAMFRATAVLGSLNCVRLLFHSCSCQNAALFVMAP